MELLTLLYLGSETPKADPLSAGPVLGAGWMGPWYQFLGCSPSPQHPGLMAQVRQLAQGPEASVSREAGCRGFGLFCCCGFGQCQLGAALRKTVMRLRPSSALPVPPVAKLRPLLATTTLGQEPASWPWFPGRPMSCRVHHRLH